MVGLTAMVLVGCGDDPTDDDGPDPAASETLGEGDVPDGEPTAPTVAIDLCEPDVEDDTIGNRSDFALVVCDAPEGTNLSIVHVTPPANRDVAVQARSTDDNDETPRVTLQATGLWPDVGTGVTTVDGDTATFAYTVFWYADGASTEERIEQDFTDDVTVGDSVTHGPLSYEVLGITDTGDPESSHLDLAVTFDPAVPLSP